MTAEIAILNRTALALAADSAVTISAGRKTKVYDTAEKLFELSCSQPLALMIYNNVEFVGVPLDVLIRKFRDEKATASEYAKVEDATNDFFDYIRSFKHDVIEEKRYLYSVLRIIFKELNESLTKEMRSSLLAFTKSKGTEDLPDPSDVILRLVETKTEAKKARPLPGFMKGVTLAQFKTRFSDVVEQSLKDTVKNVDIQPRLIEAANQLAYRVVKSSDGSDLLTGLVFGGFGKNEMFPTLRYFEIDGVYFDQVKVLSCDEVDIDRMKTRAAVVPFAQKEMVERFMYGLDTELESDIDQFIQTALDEVIDTVGAAADDAIKKAVRTKVKDRLTRLMSGVKEDARQDLLDIVYFMSKKELADIAYALVELTSHKRRFSTDEQSVGGAIDVAVLTKSEGLVWIRRKHYFDPELNHSFLARVRNRAGG